LRNVLVDGGSQNERTQTDGVDVVETSSVGGSGSGNVGGGVGRADQDGDVQQWLSGGVVKNSTEDSRWFLCKVDDVERDGGGGGGVGEEGGVSGEVTISSVSQGNGNVDWNSGLEGEETRASSSLILSLKEDCGASWGERGHSDGHTSQRFDESVVVQWHVGDVTNDGDDSWWQQKGDGSGVVSDDSGKGPVGQV